MSSYALLSEVYDDDFMKPKKKHKKKKVQFKETHNQIIPLSPQEMDTELLHDSKPRVVNSRVNPYSTSEYQELSNTDPINEDPMNDLSHESYGMENPHTVPYIKHDTRDPYQDPEYHEFLEYKQMQRKHLDSLRGSKEGLPLKSETLTNHNEQFNELLLYMFTGFFLLMLFDNIYKLGRDSY